MRVITGSARGHNLKAPKGENTRPTSDRIKEALFSIIGIINEASTVLDLFSGSGAIGIEFLSRGAKSACFVDSDSESVKTIKENLDKTKLEEKSLVYKNSVKKAIKTLGNKHVEFDYIFLDPPYNKELVIETLENINNENLLKNNGLIIIEHETRLELPDRSSNLVKTDYRKYRDTSISFYRLGGGVRLIAIYPGSFDPVTNGHLDIIDRCSKKFNKLIVAILKNNSKVGMFSVEEREELLKETLKDYDNIEIVTFSGLLVDYVKEKDIDIIVRGLRAVSDYEHEMQMALTNKSLYEEVETMFLISSTQYSFLSSSVVKEVAMFDGDIRGLVPDVVRIALEGKIEGGKQVMDVYKLLDELDELVSESSKVPLSGKAMIDKRELLELIDEIRIKLPDELKQAEWIKEERQRILSEAQTEADTMVKEVQVHIEDMIDHHEIVTEAEKRGEEILKRAQISAKEVRIGAREYADDIIGNVEDNLKQLGFRLEETIEVVSNNRKELSNED